MTKLLSNEKQIDLMTQHPCFNDLAHNSVGRVHLPVAPLCNIQCNFCEHNICATLTMQHPGWTAKLLSVKEAVDLVRSIVCFYKKGDFVVGIAGPGDPLANIQTFETLRVIHKEFPQLLMCLSTNGLLLEDKLEEIISVGIRGLTVTVNTVDSQVGQYIYSWVNYRGDIYCQEEAARLLISKQFCGIRKAADADLVIKVNTVFIPGINDEQMLKIARMAEGAGAKLMNIMPLIPKGGMRDRSAPTCIELKKKQQECEEIIPQFHHCEQCRADVVYLPGLGLFPFSKRSD
jgi:nitrogen fixation protein NifB